MKRHACVLLTSGMLVLNAGISGQRASAMHWVGTWTTSPVGRLGAPLPTPPAPVATAPAAPAAAGRGNAPTTFVPNNQTQQKVVHTTLGGDALRIVAANSFGTAPFQVGAASVALRESGSAIVIATSHAVTFGGKSTASVPADAVMMSAPVAMSGAIDLALIQ